VTLMIAENMHCSPLYHKIRELPDRGAIGRTVPVQRAREPRTSGREHSSARWSHRHLSARVPLTSKQMGTKQRPEARIRAKPWSCLPLLHSDGSRRAFAHTRGTSFTSQWIHIIEVARDDDITAAYVDTDTTRYARLVVDKRQLTAHKVVRFVIGEIQYQSKVGRVYVRVSQNNWQLRRRQMRQ